MLTMMGGIRNRNVLEECEGQLETILLLDTTFNFIVSFFL